MTKVNTSVFKQEYLYFALNKNSYENLVNFGVFTLWSILYIKSIFCGVSDQNAFWLFSLFYYQSVFKWMVKKLLFLYNLV